MNALAGVEELIARIDAAADPNVRAAARDLVQALLEFHAQAVGRMVEMTDSATVQAMGRDEIVRSLLLLYDLHPESTEVRVRRALDRVRGAEFVSLEGLDVTIRVTANGHSPTRESIEGVIHDAAPEVQSVRIEGLHTADFVPLENLLSV
jgi:hypothetical protein